MKILFIARHFTYFRNFESVVAMLAERGHHVHLAADREERQGGRDLVDRMAARFPDHVSAGFTSIPRDGAYARLSSVLRLGLDHLRYSDPQYESTPKIRERALERTPAFALRLARSRVRALATRALDLVEQAIPRDPGFEAFIEAQQPDLLLITPLIELGSPQLDYLRVAREQGLRSALCVWSWDHLSSKALIRVVPDAVIVWNETQREEAERFHGIPRERVIVTGAQCFDRWFERQPSTTREAFAGRVGLPPNRPLILYVCSALFKNSPSEAAFVRSWAAAIRRSSDDGLRRAAILVRPHPQRLGEWQATDVMNGLTDVAIWGSNPVDDDGRTDYFDSLYHASAVVGLNTSALVEAAIVDRPVLTVLLPEFRDNQEGTFHFHHLLTVGDGWLRSARSLDEHTTQLAAALSTGSPSSNRAFVEQFIRPHGLKTPATPVFVQAIEALAGQPALGQVTAWWRPCLRPAVYALALLERTPGLERVFWTPVRRAEWAENVRAIGVKGARRRDKRRDKARRIARKLPHQVVVRLKTVAKHALGAAGLSRQP